MSEKPFRNHISIIFERLGRTFWILMTFLGWQLWIWSKTYIYVLNHAIIIEKNTMKKEKETIGIKNISNVNLEQNLFERLLRTCKVKLDTNSLFTADSTDVQILMKK